MRSRVPLDRRGFLRLTGGAAAALALGRPALVRAQDAEATAAAQATATAEAQGVTVSTAVPGKTNVTWWTMSDPAWVNANKEMIARFEQANPDVHIVYQYYPYDAFISKLQTAYRSGTVADVQQMFGTWVTEYARNGLLDPVPEAMANGIKDRFWPAALGAYEWDGTFYGIPHENNIENGGMLYNPQLTSAGGVAAPPTAWQELVDDAVKLTKLNEQGRISQAGFAFTNNDSITFLLLSMILQQGATYWADDGVHVNFSTDAAKAAWQAETDLVTKQHVDDEQSYTADSWEIFFQGKAAMAMRGPWAISVGKLTFPEIQFQYVPMPPYQGTEPKYAAESGWGEVVNAKAAADVKAAAWRFVDFMQQPDNARTWNMTTFTIPALQSLKDDPQLLEVAPELKVSFDVLPYGQWVGPVQDRDRFWTLVHDAFTNVGLGRAQPLDALAQAEQQINAMIDEKVGP